MNWPTRRAAVGHNLPFGEGQTCRSNGCITPEPDGQGTPEFYGEQSDYDKTSCSGFVREAVLPQLGQYPRIPGWVFTREGLRTALLAWLDQFAGEPERAFCVDYGGDWDLLIDLLGEVPRGWEGLQMAADVGKLETGLVDLATCNSQPTCPDTHPGRGQSSSRGASMSA